MCYCKQNGGVRGREILGISSDLDNFFEKYEKSKFVQLHERPSHLVEFHQKKLKQHRNFNPKVKMSEFMVWKMLNQNHKENDLEYKPKVFLDRK